MQFSKKILIFGISGQDGSYLAQHYLKNQVDTQVHGVVRRLDQNIHLSQLHSLIKNKNLELHMGDITDQMTVNNIISKVRPSIIYNMAGQTFVYHSFNASAYTFQVNSIGVINILESVRSMNRISETKIFQALTSEMYGQVEEGTVINQLTPFKPESPYAVSKVSAYDMIKVFRKAYKMNISAAFSFNHESPRRGEHFVTRKVTKYVAQVSLGNSESPLELGNLNSYRDWGHSKDYVKAFAKIMDLQESEDFIVSTGSTHSVRQLVELTFKMIDVTIIWQGQGVNERGCCSKTGKTYVIINPIYFRPNQVPYLKGNSNKLRDKVGWQPEISFDTLIRQMLENDIKEQSIILNSRGFAQ